MRKVVATAVVGLLLVACGSDGGGRSPAAAGEYAAARASVRTLGREVVARIDAGDTDPVAARFGPELAAVFSAGQLRDMAAELARSGGIGDRTDEGELIQGPEVRIYTAEHEVGDGRWTFQLVFDAQGSIVGGTTQPSLDPLPSDPKGDYRTRSELRFPADGEWFVFWGGDTDRLNYHVRAPAQRHADDLVRWRDGGTHRGSGEANSDYWAWGQRIVAPAAGTVVVASDGLADNVPVTQTNTDHPAGNHVLLDVGPGEYLLLAHFQQGSVAVKAGDRVEAGQLLGLCGNSGNSSEPHLHVHLQSSPVPLEGDGLPLWFSDLRVDGDRVGAAELVQGQFVRADGGR